MKCDLAKVPITQETFKIKECDVLFCEIFLFLDKARGGIFSCN